MHAAVLTNEAVQKVELRLQGRPDLTVDGQPLAGRLEAILTAGQEKLPSAALGYAAGGSVQTKTNDQQGTTAAQMFFELRIIPELTPAAEAQGLRLLPGQRVIARIDLTAKPLAVQWWHELMQVVQKRFKM